jgi:hypothetical protein
MGGGWGKRGKESGGGGLRFNEQLHYELQIYCQVLKGLQGVARPVPTHLIAVSACCSLSAIPVSLSNPGTVSWRSTARTTLCSDTYRDKSAWSHNISAS